MRDVDRSAPRVEEPNRRPLRSRQSRLWRAAATRLARAGVSPNAISTFGMAIGVSAGGVLALTAAPGQPIRLLWLAGALLIQLRLLCNLLDGLVAVEGGRGTPTGPLYNEVPDRISDAATLIGLGYATQSIPALGFAAALAAVMTAYVRAQAHAFGARNDFCGPMAKPHRMFVVTLLCLFMALVPMGWQSIDGALAAPGCALAIIIAGCFVTIGRRLFRAARDLRQMPPTKR